MPDLTNLDDNQLQEMAGFVHGTRRTEEQKAAFAALKEEQLKQLAAAGDKLAQWRLDRRAVNQAQDARPKNAQNINWSAYDSQMPPEVASGTEQEKAFWRAHMMAANPVFSTSGAEKREQRKEAKANKTRRDGSPKDRDNR